MNVSSEKCTHAQTYQNVYTSSGGFRGTPHPHLPPRLLLVSRLRQLLGQGDLLAMIEQSCLMRRIEEENVNGRGGRAPGQI